MKWPQEITASFLRGLEIEPSEGWHRDQVLGELLDETARRAVWRAEADPARIGSALRWPYTPLGSVVTDMVGGRARRLGLHGPHWKMAVDALYDYIEQNAAAVCEAFRDEMEPYEDGI
jgi:hypothetical protein